MNDLSKELFERAKDLQEISMTGYQAGKTAGYTEGFRAGVKACQKGGLNLHIEQTYAAAISPLGSKEPMAYSCTDDNYEPGSIIGYGNTEYAAIIDWTEKMADMLEEEEEQKLIGKRMDPQTGVLDE